MYKFQPIVAFSSFIFKFFRIKPNLRHFDAIIDSAESDLFKALLTPNPRDFYVRNGSEGPCYPDNFFPQLNGDQRKIMSSCASMATSNPNTSQVAIVQGPPGTYNVYNTKKNWGTFGLKGGDFHPRKTLEWGFSDEKSIYKKKNFDSGTRPL